ncbi:LPXTG-motif cell wall-anchored protein/fimbrial isopeptide formation D2 family protein [Mycolicibacterium mucogenicum 261Sha1.1M5]|nr:LPXTG-motif cell wall-anchored protein/fimbrial isopeptide formation D2 family protein [Mycolicibacterium mucogenicum 261Sha1.1M5]
MKHQPSGRLRRLAVAALATGVVALGFAAPASAVGNGNFDPDAPVSLTIHKYEQPDGTLGPNTGEEIQNPGGNPLEGVEFRVQRVTSVDLTNDSGWAKLDGLTADQVIANPGDYPVDSGVAGRTDANGVFALGSSDVSVGLYLVTETDPGSHQIVQPAVPFLVTLPMPSPSGDGTWNTDVHVYPKNALANVTKEVDDENASQLGDEIAWTITSTVPNLPEGGVYTHYRVTDNLDPRLGYVSTAVSIVDGAETALVAGTDYNLTAPAVGSSGNVEVVFTSTGLAKLDAASASATVKTVIKTTVESIGEGSIDNEATVYINDPDNGYTSETTSSKWGALQILKFTAGDETKTLAGAVFDVYAVNPATAGATPILTGLTTNDAGIVKVDGLRAGTYWLVETRAPAGYERLANPIEVTVVEGSVSVPTVAKVPNTQKPQFVLPLTGGTGAMLFGIGGGLLLLAAAAMLIATRRRNQNAAAASASGAGVPGSPLGD